MRDFEQPGEVFAERVRAIGQVQHIGPAQRQHRTGGDGTGGVLPDGLAVDQCLVPEVGPVGVDPEHRLVPVGAGADLLDLAVRQQIDAVRRVPRRGQHLSRRDLALLAPPGELAQHFLVAEVPQGRELTELGGDDRDPVTGLNEGHPAVPDRVAQSAVHPVGTTLHLHPRQHLQQPPRGDLLHLRGGLGGRREVPRRCRPQTLLRRQRRVLNLFTNGHLSSSRFFG